MADARTRSGVARFSLAAGLYPMREAQELRSIAVAASALPFMRHWGNAEVPGVHDRAPPGWGIRIETAIVSGTERGSSCGPNTR
jgi:hypothetical protein